MPRVIPIEDLAELIRIDRLGEEGRNQTQVAAALPDQPILQNLQRRLEKHGLQMVNAVQVRDKLEGRRLWDLLEAEIIVPGGVAYPHGGALSVEEQVSLVRGIGLLMNVGLDWFQCVGLLDWLGWEEDTLRRCVTGLGFTEDAEGVWRDVNGTPLAILAERNEIIPSSAAPTASAA